MSKLERYNYEEAYNESAKMRKKIEGGAVDYDEAEKLVEKEKAGEAETELSPAIVERIMKKIIDLKIPRIAAVHNTSLSGLENLFNEHKKILEEYADNPRLVKDGKITDEAALIFDKFCWCLGESGDIDNPDWCNYSKYKSYPSKSFGLIDTSIKIKKQRDKEYFMGIRLHDFEKTQEYALKNEKIVSPEDLEQLKRHPFRIDHCVAPENQDPLSEEDKITLRVLKKYNIQRKLHKLVEFQQYILNNNNINDKRANSFIKGRKILSTPELEYIKNNPLAIGEEPDYNTMRILEPARISLSSGGYSSGVIGVLTQSNYGRWRAGAAEGHVAVLPDHIKGIVLYKTSKIFLDSIIKILFKYQEDIGEKDDTDYLVPIYSMGGHLLWPKKISYEEVKKIVEERDKPKEDSK